MLYNICIITNLVVVIYTFKYYYACFNSRMIAFWQTCLYFVVVLWLSVLASPEAKKFLEYSGYLNCGSLND